MEPLTTLALVMKMVSGAPKLFKKLKEVKAAVTGEPSTAATPDELKAELGSLKEDRLNECLERFMEDEQTIKLIRAQEEVDSNVTAKLSSEAADEVAVMRQTTRPWAVRMMVHYIFSPLYLVALDVLQKLIDTWLIFWKDVYPPMTFEYVFGVMDLKELSALEKVGNFIGQPQTLAAQIYIDTVPWATGIVVAYIGAREVGKGLGTSGDTPFDKLKTAGSGVVGLVGKWFKKH